MRGQKVLLEKTGAQLVEQELPDSEPQTASRDIQENSLEGPSWEGSHDQLSPHHGGKYPFYQEPVPKLTETGKHCILGPSPQLFISIIASHGSASMLHMTTF